ncbi:Protein CBG00842 [Caenorhabditis briggsae]|uniref:Protein CBG00842 n=1 Tax=Caenorhabditis briggsae TaxID=6238 RepID=A8WPH5_CAEBR|nr:Protein CBG00842 [Caenorhabditis briggsae]CAP22382.2 Protein CBG00842 [Caenorhabditis briggsae]
MDSGSDVEPPPKVSKTVDELVKKLEGLIGSHQYARQLLLKDDDRIGKKFFNASSGKHAFVIDFRISKGKTTAAVQYEGERKPIHIDFDHFQKSIDDGTFQFS